ncbi:MAG: PIG-L family deacetylase [Bacteroidetes bacterium]|nr:PIG-L family deacetylase [Bacteroidota bacterium]MBP7398443.1 PIG-L family deacetylase [Chitinophagales bacterium]MBP8753340.1 PIG-L family deacetylase [Chitinophagales bacterium]MBP9189413.1 PIG-L family deacetylase [Chitinophagales bacterium]MBP9548819.1 PIG-L family deacetylase [Chitinophagales bacterium]
MLNNKFFSTVFFLVIIFSGVARAQNIDWNAARILLELEKLNTTGNVLYMAAHPDDENTKLITYFANEKKSRTAYLSLTRGDGGQNLVGVELGAYLGLLRTEELMEARKTDGGEQFFTTAVDFGYSKTAKETFSIWNHDRLLEEAVWVIRNFQPDIIITRFPPDERAGHGQHTVSAIIAQEAFDAAADPTMFPEQLAYVKPWQTQRIFWNTSIWWDTSLAEKLKDAKDVGIIDMGLYNPLLGASYGEIAANSRTHHKSQGFGSTPVRGSLIEYLTLTKGPSFDTDIFEGINTTWERFRMGADIGSMIDSIINNYNIVNPAASLPKLLELYKVINALPKQNITTYKKQQLQNIILACAGIWLEPVATQDMAAIGENLTIVNNSIVRMPANVVLKNIEVNDSVIAINRTLELNNNYLDTMQIIIPTHASSTPYWMELPYNGFFEVKDKTMIGKPESDPAVIVKYHLQFMQDVEMDIIRGVVFKETDAVKGEIIKPLAIVPELTVNLAEDVFVFGDNKPKKIIVTAKAFRDIKQGNVRLQIADGWKITNDNKNIILQKGESLQLEFEITPPAFASSTTLQIFSSTEYAPEQVAEKITVIDHDHIQRQVVVENAIVKMVKVYTEIPALKIGYIEGAGDKVFESLQQLGADITLLNPQNISVNELMQYDVIVAGIRAYNTSKDLADARNTFKEYMEQGGIYIVQYNTHRDLYSDDYAPYPFKIGRGRVTDENSEVTFLLPAHTILNTPNKITATDFESWIQERGLYFATDLDAAYVTPLAFTDPDENAQNGSLIIADYGKGAFIYTGISFFRELPAGVPGAYRLFINLLAYKPATP